MSPDLKLYIVADEKALLDLVQALKLGSSLGGCRSVETARGHGPPTQSRCLSCAPAEPMPPPALFSCFWLAHSPPPALIAGMQRACCMHAAGSCRGVETGALAPHPEQVPLF